MEITLQVSITQLSAVVPFVDSKLAVSKPCNQASKSWYWCYLFDRVVRQVNYFHILSIKIAYMSIFWSCWLKNCTKVRNMWRGQMEIWRWWGLNEYSGLERKIPARTNFWAEISLFKSPKPLEDGEIPRLCKSWTSPLSPLPQLLLYQGLHSPDMRSKITTWKWSWTLLV